MTCLDKHVSGGKGKSKESVRRSLQLQLQFSFIRYVLWFVTHLSFLILYVSKQIFKVFHAY